MPPSRNELDAEKKQVQEEIAEIEKKLKELERRAQSHSGGAQYNRSVDGHWTTLAADKGVCGDLISVIDIGFFNCWQGCCRSEPKGLRNNAYTWQVLGCASAPHDAAACTVCADQEFDDIGFI